KRSVGIPRPKYLIAVYLVPRPEAIIEIAELYLICARFGPFTKLLNLRDAQTAFFKLNKGLHELLLDLHDLRSPSLIHSELLLDLHDLRSPSLSHDSSLKPTPYLAVRIPSGE